MDGATDPQGPSADGELVSSQRAAVSYGLRPVGFDLAQLVGYLEQQLADELSPRGAGRRYQSTEPFGSDRLLEMLDRPSSWPSFRVTTRRS